MFNSAKRPIVMFIGHKSRVLWIGFLTFVVILGILGVRLIDEPQVYSPGQSSLPVNANIDNTSIQFQVEPVKPDVSGENYFVNYRLKREQFRQETKAMLSELLNSTVEKSKEQAQEKWLELSTKIQKEGEIENLLKIKGFQDAVSDVFLENVTVIVYSTSLTPNEVSIIQDIVSRVTKVRMDKITISIKK
ncbi:SpoIIIAH-like family protein [Desulfosporosinus sp. Sb-LF]|uniref:SpoIIIAH-like family protein n=1 Tax=Desulfosporosinus sp. Sb-LF TaxID=2560027 RepID=UPI00107EFF53|nr:SpoIIIAH-like family protein [Desulfosporosinus sp. Sb-LF]TGE34227.1 SpoIIIAH-like family protein [Desulfosporosinus sp. Sb-LF]